MRDVVVEDLGEEMVGVEWADAEIGVRLVGPLAVIHALIVDADRLLTHLRYQ